MKILSKPFSQTVALFSDPTWDVSGSQVQTTLINSAPVVTWYQETYFDLAGMTIEDKTLFFEAVQIQRGYTPTFDNGATADNLLETILMVTSPITQANLLPAFVDPVGQLDYEQVVYCESRVYSKTLNEGALAFPILLHQNVISGARASATDRIYCYRILSVNPATPGSGVSIVTVPAIMMVIGADAKEEPEFQYMMRLMRSYELQNQPDRD